MRKVAIVGVEGSGKTVMLAGLGELYTHPDTKGYFLSPKNYDTSAYVTDKIRRMRQGEWPAATAGDAVQGLNWTLKRKIQGQQPESVCEVSFLDFPGEVYRAAFGIGKGIGDAEVASAAESLKQYVRMADELIVLINLHDVITKGRGDPRVEESIWITKAILDSALINAADRKPKKPAIVISQADSYKSTIEKYGGAKGVLNEYLPHVANSYDWLDMFSVSAVDKTRVDDDGLVVPASDFQPTGLQPIMDWIINKVEERPGKSTWNRTKVKVSVQDKPSPSTGTGGFFSAFARIFNYRDRADRKEYWRFLLGMIVLHIALALSFSFVDECAYGGYGERSSNGFMLIAFWGLAISCFFAFLALSALLARRAKDTGIKWLCSAATLMIVGGFVTFGISSLIAFLALGIIPGKRIPNEASGPANAGNAVDGNGSSLS